MNYRTDVRFNNGKLQLISPDAKKELPEVELGDNLRIGYKAAVLYYLHLAGIENDALIEKALDDHEKAVEFIQRLVEARSSQHPSHTISSPYGNKN